MKYAVNIAIVLAFCTIALGAYTRLTEAGLGCPDWPGCYGAMVAPAKPAQISAAQQRFPDAHIEPHKARNEMVHRYIAASLGCDLLIILFISFWQRRARIFAALILLLVLVQALLGMLTVTLNLLPLIVLGHLLGGFSLLSLLVILRLHLHKPIVLTPEPYLAKLKPVGWVALAVLLTQISLGAWTSANYAALACHQLPLCETGWTKQFDIAAAFQLPMDQASYQYGVLEHKARLSIHVLHRLGALFTLIVLSSFAFFLWRGARNPHMKMLAQLLIGFLALQITLGLINVIAILPLANAIAHNLVAASLLVTLASCIYLLHRNDIQDEQRC